MMCKVIPLFRNSRYVSISEIPYENDLEVEGKAKVPICKKDLKLEVEMKVPIWKKALLTIKEASEYFNIGETNLRRITDQNRFEAVLFNGKKKLVKRIKFEEWLCKQRYLQG